MESIEQHCQVLSPCTFWLTGLSGAGKTTIAQNLKSRIDEMVGSTAHTYVLDGDVIRQGLNKDLGKHNIFENFINSLSNISF